MHLPPGAAEWVRFADALGRFLFLNWAVQATCLLAAGLLLAALPRLRPSVRHAVLISALVLAVLSPLGHLLPRASVETTPASTGFRVVEVAVRRSVPVKRTPESYPVGTVLLVGWVLVAGFRVVRLGRQLASIEKWPLGKVVMLAPPAAQFWGVRSGTMPAAAVESSAARVPSVVGLLRPRILLPVGMADSADPGVLRQVLLHEVEHVRRHDPLWLAVAALCEGLLFWNPVAVLVRRAVEQAAEDACDAAVLDQGVAGVAYARTLLSVIEGAAAGGRRADCALGSRGSELRRRVTRVLAPLPQTSRMAGLLSGTLLLMAGGGSFAVEMGQRPVLPRVFPSQRPIAMAKAPARRSRLRRPSLIASARRTARPLRVRPRRMLAPRAPVSKLAHSASRVAPPDLEPETLDEPHDAELAEVRESLPATGRNVVFVLDTSPGMRPYQEEARSEVLGRIARLGPLDRFNLIAAGREAAPFARESVPPDAGTIIALRIWMDSLAASDGSDITAGVARAFQESDVSSVVLLSLDGLRRTTGFEAASATPSERLLVLRPSVARAADSNFVAQEQTPAFVAEERNLRQPTAIERSNTPAVQ